MKRIEEKSELKIGASKLKVIGENQKQIEYKRRKDHELAIKRHSEAVEEVVLKKTKYDP